MTTSSPSRPPRLDELYSKIEASWSKNYVRRLGHAAMLLDGAERLAFSTSAPNAFDDDSIPIPFFLLIGFTLENLLKAFLEFKDVPNARKWVKSHDLLMLSNLSRAHKLSISDDLAEFIDWFSVTHKEHWYRYPEKALFYRALPPLTTIDLMQHFYMDVVEQTDGPVPAAAQATGTPEG